LNTFVLDASVAVKWAIPFSSEPLSSESAKLLRGYVDGEIDFIVPDLFWAEVGNVFWKGARLRRWTRDLAEAAASDIGDCKFTTVSSQALLPDALKIAFAHDCSVYDCLYVALAIQFKIQMITADERLANALAARLPVKWLGALVI
jgi:predicted nucleic acid-binding protein